MTRIFKTVFQSAFFSALLCAAIVLQSPATTEKSISNETLNGIRTHIEQFRGLKFKSDVKTIFLDSESILKIAHKLMAAEGMNAEKITRMKKTMVALGLIEPGFDLSAAFDSIFSEQVQGLYDPLTRTLYVRSDVKNGDAFMDTVGMSETEFALSHEYGHALQDQHYNLLRISALRNSNEDAAVAFAAVAEGDATIIMLEYGSKDSGFNMPNAPMFAKFMETFLFGSGKNDFLKDMPDTIKAQLIFPYTEGMKFIANLYNVGGWDLVNLALSNPPESTEQLMHPEKYIKKLDPPVNLSIPDITNLLPDGYKLTDSNTAGEFITGLVINEYLSKEKHRAAAAAAGWGGDKYILLEANRSHDVFAWVIEWDSQNDAEEFTKTFSESLNNRFGAQSVSNDYGVFEWTTECGKTELMLKSTRTIFLHCAPSESAKAVLSALMDDTAATRSNPAETGK